MIPWRPSNLRRAHRASRPATLLRVGAGLAAAAAVLASCSNSPSSSSSSSPSSSSSSSVHAERVPGGATGTYLVESGIHKIRHVIVIEQENRSFDSYFGTYPGADGIPTKNGEPTVCVNDPVTTQCVAPYHDTADSNGGGPHGEANRGRRRRTGAR